MQDMATMQHHSITSPAPANTQDSSIDPLLKTNCDREMHHETSRTGAENYEEVPKEEEEEQEEEEEDENTVPKEDLVDQEDDAESGMRYVCPICEAILLSQHDFTLHIRSHNNDTVDDGSTPPSSTCAKGYSCRICGKVLSSSSSLDRHVLVHSGERPFKCSICGVAFTTNGNMHRHMRKHGASKPENYESDGSTDSGGSLNLPTTICTVPKKRKDCLSEPWSPPTSDGSGKRKTTSDVLDMNSSEKRRVKSESTSSSEGSQRLQCPVCDRDEFSSVQSLEAHLDLSHPEYGGTGAGIVRCGICDASFKSQRELSLHRFMVHRDASPASRPVMGFKDLTFVDFSSQKFPYIARALCERSLHRPTSAFHRFQCDVCGRAFPCGSALAIHRAACATAPTPYRRSLDFDEQNDTPTDLTSHRHLIRSNTESEEEVEERKREDFFAGLDLRNKTISPSSPRFGERRGEEKFESGLYFNTLSSGAGKDLADIQSILSVTSGSSMLQDLSGGPGAGEEEQQDCFAVEFRRMKQKGEFPCRLCPAVFPNLRALKGHNRAHLSTGSGPFQCNMCSYSHGDKAVLVRHMRTHNGDRPYECALCNYAFTTKANCERHLRNRHSKVTRDDVKKSIIYHPSQDPTNEPDNIPSVPPSPAPPSVKRALVFGHDEESHSSRWDTQEVATMTNLTSEDGDDRMGDTTDLSADETTDNEDVLHQRTNIETLVNLTKNNKSAFTKLSPPTLENQRTTSESSLRHVGLSSVNCYAQEVNSPLDLSMDALDLSKKRDTTPIKDEEDDSVPQDLSKKSNIEYNNNNKKPAVFMSATAKSEAPMYGNNVGPKLDVATAAYYASHHLSPLFLNNNGYSFHHAQGPFPVHPYFISTPSATPSPHPLFPPSTNMQEIAEMKERLQKELIRGLQLTSGGSLLDNLTGTDRLQTYHQQAFADMARKKDIKQEVKESIPIIDKVVSKPLSSSPMPNINNNNNNINIINNNNNSNNNKAIRDRDTSSSVKMVIKNGVLMPKQKQRRYRTERPFACEHCSARFTLRSNMERHVKQQHPQFWSQRQRGGSTSLTGIGRRIQPPLVHEDKPTPPPVITVSPPDGDPRVEDEDNNNGSKTFISDEVRLAIAQQLKSKLTTPSDRTDRMEDEEDGGDLVIDEDKTVDEETAVIPSSDILHRPMLTTPDRKDEGGVDLASVSRLLDNASTQTFQQYFRLTQDVEEFGRGEGSEEDEEGLVAGSNSEGNNSGSDENRSESDTANGGKKKSAYSLAPNRVSCPYCMRKFPWSSSLRRHVLTHTGQKPYKCPHCPLLFTTKSNCDRHLLRKHGGTNNNNNNSNTNNNSNNHNSAGNSTAGSSSDTSPATTASVTTPTASSYTMRNVPERPYKCNHCPSSTFSTQSNLRKHVATKHGGSSPTSPLPPGVIAGPLDSSILSTGGNSHCGGDESHGSGGEVMDASRIVPTTASMESSEPMEEPVLTIPKEPHVVPPPPPSSAPAIPSAATSELPFKCHLCEGGFADRQDALEHIREMHCAEYELLMSKGALEAAPEDNNNIHASASAVPGSHEDGGDESLEQLRGKFPDYANRKVMCAFCLRRFWSAEDLRRHMRTHTGERPFSCDICRRRFTLKHSMLRHRKKHTMGTPPADDASSAMSGDDEPSETPVLISASASAVPASSTLPPPPPPAVVNHNNNTIISAIHSNKHRILIEKNVEDETDLIGNLLGIQDKSIIDKVLQSKSADDAAKLLGVKNGSH